MPHTDHVERITIVYVIPTLGYGGAERQLIELCTHLDASQFDITIALLNDDDALLCNAYPQTRGFEVTTLRRRGKFDVRKLWELRRLYRSRKADVVHSFLPTGNFWGGLSARLSGRHVVVASSRGMHYRRLNKWSLMNRLSLNVLADAVLVNSEAVRDNCIRLLRVRPDKITRIPNSLKVIPRKSAPDVGLLKRRFGINGRSGPVISTVGRIDPLKGIDLFVEAAAMLAGQDGNATFLVAGRGPQEEALRRRVEHSGLSEAIRFLGFVDEIEELLAISDVFALPTLSEGCSNAILEAMAAGKAIVVTDIPANRELIADGRTGLLVQVGDAAALADGIRRLLNDPELAHHCGANARQKALEFDVARVTRVYEAFYRALVQERGRVENSATGDRHKD
ncbi:MAG: glycosyltransferase [Phycisphaerae bacterium]|nr:glycosyltransferase [Phycisphaerae bacterium]